MSKVWHNVDFLNYINLLTVKNYWLKHAFIMEDIFMICLINIDMQISDQPFVADDMH